MNLILIISVLLLGTNSGWAHSIARIEELHNEVNTTQSQDVYEVKDGSSPLQFVYPKQKKPTLREIIYYHVIERPYEDTNTDKTVLHKEVDDFDKPVRHVLLHKTVPDFKSSVRHFTNSHAGIQFVHPELDKEPIRETPENPDIIPNEDLADESLIKVPDNKEGATDEEEDDIMYIDEAENEDNEVITKAPEDPVPKNVVEEFNTDDKVQTGKSNGDETIETITEPAKRARKLLFDRVREKYYNKNNEQKYTSTVANIRRKRDLTGKIPEAPKLKELDMDSLPPHIRNMIAVGQNYFKDADKKKDLEEIKHKMKGIFDKLDEDKDSSDGPSPKTYGMRLDGDTGYVWNDMLEPGVSYEIVPHTEKQEKERKKEEEKPKVEANKEQDVENDKKEKVQSDKEETDERSIKSKNDKEDSKENNTNEQNIESEADGDEKKNEIANSGELRKQKKRKEKDDPMKELIENEQFWKWLEDWTSVYIEELNKHIKNQIKVEVTKQVKNFTKPPKDDKEKITSEQGLKDKENKESKDNNDKSDDLQKESADKAVDETKNNIETSLMETTEKSVAKENATSQVDNEGTKSKKETAKENLEGNEEKQGENKTSSVFINAKNMYGSSIGSDKVTNFFIFYPSKDIKDIMTEVKPGNNSEQGNFVIGTSEVDKKEENKTNVLETTTATADKTTPSENEILEKTLLENEVDETLTTEKVGSTTEPKKDEKEQTNDPIKKKETDEEEESSADKKRDSESSEKDDTEKEKKEKEKKNVNDSKTDKNKENKEEEEKNENDENEETSKENEVNQDSETEKQIDKSEKKE